jgi:hypothetical protein
MRGPVTMKILAHRGHWLEPKEKNGFAAFERAWSGAHGIETDLRDLDGDIVVSHDPPEHGACTFASFLQAYTERGRGTPLALNIKADGLQRAVAGSLAKHHVQNFFVFDMSVPDSLHYLRAGMPVFLRLSEYEPQTPLLDRAAGVWLDAFEGEWWALDTVRALHARGKSIAIVSPELHGRPHEKLWQALLPLDADIRKQVMLCTDFPEEADRFFGS